MSVCCLSVCPLGVTFHWRGIERSRQRGCYLNCVNKNCFFCLFFCGKLAFIYFIYHQTSRSSSLATIQVFFLFCTILLYTINTIEVSFLALYFMLVTDDRWHIGTWHRTGDTLKICVYYLHTSRDSVSPVCGITEPSTFFSSSLKTNKIMSICHLWMK